MKKVIILMATVVLLKAVKVKRSIFTKILVADDVRKYIETCVEIGSAATLYADPAISAAFYADGTTAANNIAGAIKTYKGAPTTGNLDAIETRRTEGITWLESYSTFVEAIANLDANRATREAAFANITQSNLTPQKLTSSSKGIPENPAITGKITGAKTILLEVINGETYIPSQTNFLLVQLPEFTTAETPDPIVVLTAGQISITGATGEVITKSVSGKGKSTTVSFSNTGVRYAAYAYAQNGKKLVSKISARIIIEA